MKCEFARDHHGCIWFQHATQIYVRPNMNAKKHHDEEINRIRKINEANRLKLIKETDNHKKDENETRK